MANLYDLKRFDLNLLVIFECIYQHLSISKAAQTLFITPSAVSQSLQRLRIQLNDPLFVRSGKGITPTTVGVNLHHHLAENLNQLEQTINIMSRSVLTKRFVIYGPPIFLSGRLKTVITQLLEDPNIEVEHYDYIASEENIEDLMNYRKSDIILSTSPVNNRSIVCEPFVETEISMVCRHDHPRLGDSPTMEEILEERFAIYDSEEPGIISIQADIDRDYPGRKTGFRSNSLIGMVDIIQKSDLIGVIPRSLFDYLSINGKLRELTPPIPLITPTIYLIYNRAALNTPSFAKIIEKISNSTTKEQDETAP